MTVAGEGAVETMVGCFLDMPSVLDAIVHKGDKTSGDEDAGDVSKRNRMEIRGGAYSATSVTASTMD